MNLFENDELRNSTSSIELYSNIKKVAADMGFDRSSIQLTSTKPNTTKIESWYHNYPTEFVEHYEKQQWFHIDPIIKQAKKIASPQLWSEHLFASDKERDMYDILRMYSMHNGISLPLHCFDHSLVILCFASSTFNSLGFLKLVKESVASLCLLRDLTAQKFKNLERSNTISISFQLSSIERNCLAWYAAGKSIWEISKILDLSEGGVKYHLANLRKKFDATTTHQVIEKIGVENLGA